MTLRLTGLALFALLSSACTFRTLPGAYSAPVDYSDYAYYDQAFGQSPGAAARPHAEGSEGFGRENVAARPVPGGAIGFVGGANIPLADEGADTKAPEAVTAEAEDTEYQEVEATPGTACYDAALKAGIKKGVCTLITERKYLLVGEKDEQSL
jgi:hypothetical protein